MNVGSKQSLNKNSNFVQTLFKLCSNNVKIQTLFVLCSNSVVKVQWLFKLFQTCSLIVQNKKIKMRSIQTCSSNLFFKFKLCSNYVQKSKFCLNSVQCGVFGKDFKLLSVLCSNIVQSKLKPCSNSSNFVQTSSRQATSTSFMHLSNTLYEWCFEVVQGDPSRLGPVLGWLDFGCSTILPGQYGTPAWGIHQISHPNPGPSHDGSPCIVSGYEVLWTCPRLGDTNPGP